MAARGTHRSIGTWYALAATSPQRSDNSAGNQTTVEER
jgi:hypothetical protein